MFISELIDQLTDLEDEHGDMLVELDSGREVTEADVVYTDASVGAKPVSVVIK